MQTDFDSPLGKLVRTADRYAPELLFPISRAIKRREIALDEPLPFVGEDVWNAYELSWLEPNGKPVVALGRFRVPAWTPNLIESKSLKLYLNSFNQTAFPGLDAVAETLTKDLSRAVGGEVDVEIHLPGTYARPSATAPKGECLDALDVACDTYSLEPEFLRVLGPAIVEETLYSRLLKSNCPVTGQPDWGTIAIRYRGRPIDRAGLLRYIVSFRRHNEFHEQCVERVFCDILERCVPEALAVQAHYTRRGGLDINPFRASAAFSLPDTWLDPRQ
jgi:7-cyano-7-deazaguanine reductase